MTDMMELLTRRASMKPQTFNVEDRSVEVIWSTGASVRRRDMAGQYIERLSLAPEAVDLSRLQGASVLDAHHQSAVRDVLGSVRSAMVDGQRGAAIIQFSARPEVEPIWQDVMAGILRHVSVGYSVERWAETTEDGARVLTAVRWTPHEISLVPTPADPGAHIRMETPMTERQDIAAADNTAHHRSTCDAAGNFSQTQSGKNVTGNDASHCRNIVGVPNDVRSRTSNVSSGNCALARSEANAEICQRQSKSEPKGSAKCCHFGVGIISV
jgi:phage head maturation protease